MSNLWTRRDGFVSLTDIAGVTGREALCPAGEVASFHKECIKYTDEFCSVGKRRKSESWSRSRKQEMKILGKLRFQQPAYLEVCVLFFFFYFAT